MSNPTDKFPPEVFRLFDKYVHGQLSRRDFIDRAGALAIAGMSGAALLDALNPKFAAAQQIAPTDARLKEFAGVAATLFVHVDRLIDDRLEALAQIVGIGR